MGVGAKKHPQQATINKLLQMISNIRSWGIHSGEMIPVQRSYKAQHRFLDRKESKLDRRRVKFKNYKDVKPTSDKLKFNSECPISLL